MAKIHFLNVDEGDCSIIEHDNGNVTMIDICCGKDPGVFHGDRHAYERLTIGVSHSACHFLLCVDSSAPPDSQEH